MAQAPIPCPKIVRGQEKLTPEQEAYARQFAQEHIAAMLSTTAIDEQEAESHLREAYRMAGLKPPTRIRWFDSPISFVRDSVGARVWDSVGDSVWDSVGHSVWDSVMDSVGVSFWDRVGGIVGVSVWDSVVGSVVVSFWDSVGHSVMDSVMDSVWDSVMDSVGHSVGDYVMAYLFMDSVMAYLNENLLAFCLFFHEVFKENKLIHFALFNEMVSGYWLGSKEAWLVRKPIRLECDEQGRLHSASGMCLAYRDGWGFYAWHGVRVPEKIIMHPESLTKDDWLNEKNLEIRRVIQERLGSSRFVELIGARCIDTGKHGELLEIDLSNDPEQVAHYVHVQDASTPREYLLRVPPSIRRADDAVAWTFGLDVQAYQPIQET